jgi:hypothetical protein
MSQTQTAVPSNGLVKPLLATTVALVGAGLLSWSVYDTYFRPEPAVARVFAADSEPKGSKGDSEPSGGQRIKLDDKQAAEALNRPKVEMVADATFPKVASDEDAAGLMKDLTSKFADAGSVLAEVSPAPVQAADQLAEVTSTFLGRLMGANNQDPLEVIKALGGETKNEKGEPIKGSVVTKLGELLKHASIDVSKAQIIKPVEPQLPPGMKGMKLPLPPGASPDNMIQMMNVSRTSHDDGKEKPAVAAGGSIRSAGDAVMLTDEEVEATLTTPLIGLFPGVNVDAKIAKVEVRAPIQFHDEAVNGGKPTQIGLVLALNPATNKWQPASLNFYAGSMDTLKGISKWMRNNAKPAPGAASTPKIEVGK